jgi:hypothetical protein
VRTERYRYTEYPDGKELYDHKTDPHEWYNLAGNRQFTGVMEDLARMLPENRSQKAVKQWKPLSDEEKNLFVPPPGRHQMSDPENLVDLPETL